jgi:hypothetical protein
LALLIFAVIGLFAFLFQAIKSIIFFFTGQRFFPELPEDKELRLLKEKQNAPMEAEKDIVTPYHEIKDMEEPQEGLMSNLTRENTPTPTPEVAPALAPAASVEEACFKPSFETEPKEEEPVVEEDIHEEVILNDFIEDEQPEIEEVHQNITMGDEEHTILETAEEKESEEDLVEELETYIPRSSNYSASDEDEDIDTGVDIDYDVR